ncbi:MAG: DegT/DnrJ/EryC1/StrS family aminotransferase [Candidatus Hydrogenedentota bacterium]
MHDDTQHILDGKKRAALRARYGFGAPLYVTRPALPALADFTAALAPVWERRWLTNQGDVHQAFEGRLAAYLGTQHVSLFCNGTIALLVALQALDIREGEVITTAFTFPATPHVIHWNRLTPVFCDITPDTWCLDPARVEAAITARTRAILGVHVYGTPCDVDALADIADRHGLPLVYDAAHTFGAHYRGRALADYGDMAALSFHATKLFTTAEGGALVTHHVAARDRVYFLKNFGIAGEEDVIGPGINGKMNEIQAALGLLQLAHVEDEIARRRALAATYRRLLADLPGLTLPPKVPDLERNWSYFPVLVDAETFGMSRDALYEAMRACNIYARKYFHPLCSTFACYASLPSAAPDNLAIAHRVAGQVLCLPIFGDLAKESVERIGALIAACAGSKT